MFVSRTVMVGGVGIGGNNPVRVQSMCNTSTHDVKATVKQIRRLEQAGCELVRVAVPDMKSARALREIKKRISIPLIADIHFDYRLALASVPFVDKLRINPGTLPKDKLREVVLAAKHHRVAMRIGVNTGSMESGLEGGTVERMVESVARSIKLLEIMGFHEIIVALKSSDVVETIEAYREFSKRFDYPTHLGLTEAGIGMSGAIRSSVALGVLLSEGIGDTIRVSLTGNSVNEVHAGYEILRALKLREQGVTLISCPTCARCSVDLTGIVMRARRELRGINAPLKIAIMGCEVNGPGEAKDADIGLAFSNKRGLIFKNGGIIKEVSYRNALPSLLIEVRKQLAS